MPLIVEINPIAVGLDGSDLTDDTAPYEGELLDFSDYRQFMVAIDVATGAGGTVGAADLSLRLLANDKVTVLSEVDLLTAVGTDVDGSELVVFGRGLTPFSKGTGTIGPDIGILKVMRWVQFVLEVTTESDATTSEAKVRVYCGN